MRLAISGAHRTGKTTLVRELLRALPAYEAVAEPYETLAEEGHTFGAIPSLEDFEQMLERSIESIETAGNDCLFDRCPADLLAYLVTHVESRHFDLGEWLPRAGSALERLDLIIYVPIEHPDRVPRSEVENEAWRSAVDEELREILLDDCWALGVEVLEVTGALPERTRRVLDLVQRRRDG